MHAGLMPNGRVVFLDKVETFTQIKLDDGEPLMHSGSSSVAILKEPSEPMR